ncbi:hypothetical protein AVEN_145738-2, partial [Araneus ventricosus]
GGLNNAKYRCSLPETAIAKKPKTPRQVLLRIYGPLQEDLNDIVREVATFLLLAERKLGPKLYGVFPNGRLEEFIPVISRDFHYLSSVFNYYISTVIKNKVCVCVCLRPLQHTYHEDTWRSCWEGFDERNAQEDLNDIVREVAIFLLLAGRKLGPKLYGVFPNGRLEEFIPSRTLLSKDYKVMYPAIAREMAKFHSLDVPVRKIPDLWTAVMRKPVNDCAEAECNRLPGRLSKLQLAVGINEGEFT